MSRITIEEVEQRLITVKCAICKGNQFMVDRRTLQPDGECKGVCKQCRYSFPIHTDMDFYRRTQPDIPYLMRAIPCQKCEKQGVSLDFRIVMSVREAFYFVTCTACSHTFSEKSLLEAFE